MTATFQGFLMALHIALCLVGMWCTLCRLNYMGRATRHAVTVEHFFLGLLCTALLAVQTSPWVFVVLAAVLARFALTSKRWLHPLPNWSLRKYSLMK